MEPSYLAAVHNRALTMTLSTALPLSCWIKDGLWKATQAGMTLLMTRSHRSSISGPSL